MPGACAFVTENLEKGRAEGKKWAQILLQRTEQEDFIKTDAPRREVIQLLSRRRRQGDLFPVESF